MLGVGLMPFTTVLDTEKLAFSWRGTKLSVPSCPSRVAASISTSAGELTRDSTRPEGNDRVQGKLDYTTSTSTLVIAEGVVS